MVFVKCTRTSTRSTTDADFDPAMDGVDHINIYSRGKTELGQFLTNFADAPFKCSLGDFRSVEGLWYWMMCAHHPDRDVLRTLSGRAAKKKGRELKGADWSDSAELRRTVTEATEIKIRSNERMARMLAASKLPLVHYYVMYGRPLEPIGGKWLIEFIRQLRDQLRVEFAEVDEATEFVTGAEASELALAA